MKLYFKLKVFFIKTNARDYRYEILVQIYNLFKNKDFRNFYTELNKIFLFRKEQKKFRVISKRKSFSLQGYVFGSDEIWNFERKRNAKQRIFWGEGLKKSIVKISYAPSINNSSENLMKNHKSLYYLKKFNAISVRDIYSKQVMEKILKRQVHIVLDPTLLVKREFFFEKEYPVRNEEKFFLIYSYGLNLTPNLILQIQNEAVKRKCKIISIGKYFKWADYNICCTPEVFLGYMHKAELVITDTFHGTVFSMIYKKKVLIVCGESQKVKAFVNQMKLEEMTYRNEFIICEHYLEIWEKAYEKIRQYREDSEKYLSILENI